MTSLSRRHFLILPLGLAACQLGGSVLELTGLTMGTTYSVVAVDHTKSFSEEDLRKAIDSHLATVNAQMSNWDAASEISRFNASASTAPMTVSPELAAVMQAAQDVHIASDGQFDVTLGPLIEKWGFGARTVDTPVPSESDIFDALAASGQADMIRVDGNSLQKTHPDAQIYLSAIGKGFGVDHVAQGLKALGFQDFMVEIGGDIYTSGRNPEGMPWQIGIETPNPFDRGVQQVVGLTNMGMATSGDYRNYFEKDGERFSHILDAKTGRPVTHATTSATVLAENAMLADAWATAMLVLGKERGLEIADQLNLAVMFIERDTDSTDIQFKTTPSVRFAQLQA